MRYVDSSRKILAHTQRLADWQAGRKPGPIGIEWDLSNRCDLGCAGCHFGYTHTRGPLAHSALHTKPVGAIAGGDLADTSLVMRAIGEALGMGVESIVWTGGGEPTLHPDFDEIIDQAHFLCADQGLYTNGLHIGAARAESIGKLLDWVVISLDACNADDYADYKQTIPAKFDVALEGVRQLVKAHQRCVVGLSFLLSDNNWRRMWEMLDLARSLGVDYATFRPLVLYKMDRPSERAESADWITTAMTDLTAISREPDVECSPQRFAEYRDWTGERSYAICYGIRYNTTITPNGQVWVCVNRREFPDSLLGDLRVESFRDIWSRHPGRWTDFEKCRVYCRLHALNKTVWDVHREYAHENFV